MPRPYVAMPLDHNISISTSVLRYGEKVMQQSTIHQINRLYAKFIDANYTRMAKLIFTKEKLWLCPLIGASRQALLNGVRLRLTISMLPNLLCQI